MPLSLSSIRGVIADYRLSLEMQELVLVLEDTVLPMFQEDHRRQVKAHAPKRAGGRNKREYVCSGSTRRRRYEAAGMSRRRALTKRLYKAIKSYEENRMDTKGRQAAYCLARKGPSRYPPCSFVHA
jgi:hypothetical protein